MKIEKTELVKITDDSGREIKQGNTIVITFKAERPDVIGVFNGIGKRDTVDIICKTGDMPKSYAIMQKSIEAVKVVTLGE